MPAEASAIYQEWLDIVSEPLLQGDVDVLQRYVSLPYLHRSEDNRTVIETREDMAHGFKVFSDSLLSQGANQIVRLVSSAEYLSDDYIQGAHVTHVLRNATPVVPSFVSQLSLRRCPTHWKMVENYGGYAHGTWPVRMMRVGEETQNAHETDEYTDARREAAQPLALYQRFLNALTRANVTDDFDAYCKLCSYPYTGHTRDEDVVIATPEETWPFFDMLSHMLRDNKIEEFARIADHAEFISGDTICGYHTSRFISEGAETLDPIKSRMILRRTGTRWFLHSVTNAITNTKYPFSEPVAVSDLVPERIIQERIKT